MPTNTTIPASKLVLPNNVPHLLLERRTRLLARLDKDGEFPRFQQVIPNAMKEKVLRVIFKKHFDDLKPFFSPDVHLIGGIAGKRANWKMLQSLASLKLNVWGENDGGKLAMKDYCALLARRERQGSATPTFVQMNGKELAGAVFPIQVNTEDVTTHAHMISSHTYALDTITGAVLACPIICANPDTKVKVKGVGKTLIVNGVLPYAQLLAHFGYMVDLIAYSRPANFGAEKQKNPELTILEHLPEDFNYKYFHNKNGASVVCVVEGGSGELAKMTGGFGFIAGYTSHLRPSEDFLAVLEKIGRTVEKMLR